MRCGPSFWAHIWARIWAYTRVRIGVSRDVPQGAAQKLLPGHRRDG
jgi:hypothetical protein